MFLVRRTFSKMPKTWAFFITGKFFKHAKGVLLNSIAESLKPVDLCRVFLLVQRNATEADNVKRRLCSPLSVHPSMSTKCLLVSLVTLSVLEVLCLQIKCLCCDGETFCDTIPSIRAWVEICACFHTWSTSFECLSEPIGTNTF